MSLHAIGNSEYFFNGDTHEMEIKMDHKVFDKNVELHANNSLKDTTKTNVDKTNVDKTAKDNITVQKKDTVKLQELEKFQDKTKIKLTGSQLYIEDLPEDNILEIYNIMGVKVFNHRVKAGTNQFVLPLSKGYYIIKIGKLTRKIAVK